jgi:phosphoglycerate dehydrogenase-like enzyme
MGFGLHVHKNDAVTVVIASQMDEMFNAALRALPSAPSVIAVSEDNLSLASREADMLLVCPSPVWHILRDDERNRPELWPGRLRWVYAASTGVDAYPKWLLEAPIVTCGRGVASEDIADYVMAAVYLQSKDLEAHRAVAPEQWRPTALGRVFGSTIGILGMGAIGEAVARRAIASGAYVTATRRRALPSPVEGVTLLDKLSDVVASADHLIIALPGTETTRRVVDAELLSHAKPGMHLINIARGSIVDQAALIDALDAGRLAFATLDVTEPEPLPPAHRLWRHPKVRLTPHISALSVTARESLLAKVTVNLDRFIRDQPLLDVVDVAAGY